MDYHACIDLEIEGRVWCPQLELVATIDADWPRMDDWYVTAIALEFTGGERIELNANAWLFREIVRVLTTAREHVSAISYDWALHRRSVTASRDRAREIARVGA